MLAVLEQAVADLRSVSGNVARQARPGFSPAKTETNTSSVSREYVGSLATTPCLFAPKSSAVTRAARTGSTDDTKATGNRNVTGYTHVTAYMRNRARGTSNLGYVRRAGHNRIPIHSRRLETRTSARHEGHEVASNIPCNFDLKWQGTFRANRASKKRAGVKPAPERFSRVLCGAPAAASR